MRQTILLIVFIVGLMVGWLWIRPCLPSGQDERIGAVLLLQGCRVRE